MTNPVIDILSLMANNILLEQRNGKLKTENDDLKKQVDDLLHKPEIQDKILWKIDNEALLGSKDAYIYKLKQTLTEIKEIAEKTLNMVDYKTYFKRDNKSLKQEIFKALNEILQKISKVEK